MLLSNCPIFFFDSFISARIFFRSSNSTLQSFLLWYIFSCSPMNSFPKRCSSRFWFSSSASTLNPILYSSSFASEDSLLNALVLLQLILRGDVCFLRLTRKLRLILISLEERTRVGPVVEVESCSFVSGSSFLHFQRQLSSTMTEFWFSIKKDNSDICLFCQQYIFIYTYIHIYIHIYIYIKIAAVMNMVNLSQFQPYLNEAVLLAVQISQHTHFQIIAVVVTVVVGLLVGRLSHEKKLTNLLDLINDADTTRKQISEKLTKTNQSLKDTRNRKKILIGVTVFLLLANAVLFYSTHKIDLKFIGGTLSVLLFVWGIYIARSRYLAWSKKSLEENLRKTSMNAEAEIKQILQLLGTGVTTRMKSIFETQLNEQWAKQSKQDCRLAKCANQKSAYKELFGLYEQIIQEIKQINMCDICLNQENISVQKLAMGEFQTMLGNCRRALGRASIEQKKQIVNRLMEQYKKMYEKLPLVCKKGCCIRQRTLIEASKARHHEDLKRAMAKLNQ